MEKYTSLPFNPDNDEDVAEWFAKHDATELSLESVEEVHVKKQSPTGLELLTIRIASEDMDQLKRLAKEYGVGYTTIARMLLHRELRDPRPLARQ